MATGAFLTNVLAFIFVSRCSVEIKEMKMILPLSSKSISKKLAIQSPFMNDPIAVNVVVVVVVVAVDGCYDIH